MRQATIVGVLDSVPRAADLPGATDSAHWLELRSDRAGDIEAAWLRAHVSGPLLYAFSERTPDRTARLLRAARTFDFIDLGPADLIPEVLQAIPAERRVLSQHLENASLTELGRAAEALTATPARLYRLTTTVATPGEALAPLQLLHQLGRDDVTAFAVGPAGLWTRILAPWLGAPVVFGGIVDDDVPSGRPSVARLVDSFAFPDLPAIEELYGMAGFPVLHSLSPRIHNTAFRTLGRAALYLPFPVADFETFWKEVVESRALDALGFPLRGLSVVSPHKSAAISLTRHRSPIVHHALSANVVRREGDDWFAETTDAAGVLLTLRDRGVQPRNQRVAVIGCGGSGRAMAAALHEAGAEVTLVNRGSERGSLAVRLLHLPFFPLSAFSCEDYSIVVNATPVGRDSEELPFPVQRLRRDAVVVDLVYRDAPTPLIARTRGPGRITIDGWDMLMAQARHQFELMTGMQMPYELIRQTLGFAPVEALAE
jgi:3-dehydroquinate dehydratase/shikimate dehydrogenase